MIAWIKLEKQFFGLNDDVHIAIVYFVPEGSTNETDDPFRILQDDIAQLPDRCQFLICGDYNARTNVLPDCDIDDMFGGSGGLEDVLPDSSIDPITNINDSVIKVLHDAGKLSRYTKDMSAANNNGKKLLDLCKSSRLLIMNGDLELVKESGTLHELMLPVTVW